LRGRPGREDLAVEHMEDLLHSALSASDLDIAKRIEQELPPEDLLDAEGTRFHLTLLENKEWFTGLEERCRLALTRNNDEPPWSNSLVDLSYNLENLFPALSVIFSRAAIVERPESFFDSEMLLDVIRRGRTELDLDPWADPIEDYLDWAMERLDTDIEVGEKEKEIEELKRQVSNAHRRSAEKDRELREKQLALNELLRKAEKEEKAEGTSFEEADHLPSERAVGPPDTVLHLKERIERLKMEVTAQQHERRKLREQLQEKQKEAREEKAPPMPESLSSSVTEDSPEFEKAPKKIPIPEYSDAFRASCQSVPPAFVAKALRIVAGFAAQEQEIRRQSRGLERMPGVYRIRIGTQYRLLIRWVKGSKLEVLDLIIRQNLETWIKRHTG
jgi:hypothetical protein